ncbi:MAG: EF2563 family selenium-dependent molybdenum hydroxylase system protein [Acidobacteria bacterium]|nr:EF2563 family selenium-dependent molybdenum hydroxylase system protein [Acidobacteriota bacterium]
MLCTWIRGGGDLGTGVALRLHRMGIKVMITELARPMAVRRAVSFSEAVYEGEWRVEGVSARRADSADDCMALIREDIIPVLVAPVPPPSLLSAVLVVVDARLTKRAPETDASLAPLVIGLGPGFEAGADCHAVVETQRGPTLGRVYWSGSALPDTALPDGDPQRVLRAPADGILETCVQIGDHVEAGQVVALVDGQPIASPLRGVVRGLLRSRLDATRGLKIGDIDTRDVREHCFLVSDKALAVAGGVVEAIFSRPDLRSRFRDS